MASKFIDVDGKYVLDRYDEKKTSLVNFGLNHVFPALPAKDVLWANVVGPLMTTFTTFAMAPVLFEASEVLVFYDAAGQALVPDEQGALLAAIFAVTLVLFGLAIPNAIDQLAPAAARAPRRWTRRRCLSQGTGPMSEGFCSTRPHWHCVCPSDVQF